MTRVLPIAFACAALIAGTTAVAGATPTEPRSLSVTPRPKVVAIAVAKGRVVGGIKRVKVRRGTRVTLTVRADVRDEVHVHGYDLMRRVAPGAPARISFRATVPGRFEVELEKRALQIAELTVTP
jgi:hypothetical protein